MHVHMCVVACVHVCMPEVDIGCLLQLPSPEDIEERYYVFFKKKFKFNFKIFHGISRIVCGVLTALKPHNSRYLKIQIFVDLCLLC